MGKLSKRQSRSLIYRYMLTEGWLPKDTTEENWGAVLIGDLCMDNPPVPSDPHMQKRRAAGDIQNLFFVLGSSIKSPLPELKKPSRTLHQLADWCFENQQ